MLASDNGSSRGSLFGEIVKTSCTWPLFSTKTSHIWGGKKGRGSVFKWCFCCEMVESGNDGGGQMVRDWSKLGKLCPSAAKNGLARARGAKLCRVSSWWHHHQHQAQDHHHHQDQVQDHDQDIAKPKIELRFQSETRMRNKWKIRARTKFTWQGNPASCSSWLLHRFSSYNNNFLISMALKVLGFRRVA